MEKIMNKDTEFLIDVVRRANELITEDFEVNAKGNDGDLVTNFDYEIEKFIIGEINKAYPGFDIISEEFNTEGKLTKNCFVIDPIDGTITFAHGCPDWAIQVACIKSGKTVSAVIFLPKLAELYWADETGAFLNGKSINVNTLPIHKCLFEVHGKGRLSALTRMLPYSKHFRRSGSAAVSYAYVAAGRFGGIIFRNESVWDYIPGMFIAKQAGAYLIDEYECHIAANSKEFAELLKKEAMFRKGDV